MADDEFDAWVKMLPESKLELIDGQLIVGNSLTATKLLLKHILEGWGAAAALALIDRKLCWKALKIVYPTFESTNPEWASKVDYRPEDLSAGGQGQDCEHWWARRFLSSQLSRAINLSNSGHSFGHDFVMRLNENGFTPEISVCCNESLSNLYTWYLDGPAHLVIEIILPAHAAQDRKVKQHYYEIGEVPEYWIVDPEHHEIELLRLVNGQYKPQSIDAQGCYRPHNFPNLVFIPAKLWQSFSTKQLSTPSCFKIENHCPGKNTINWDKNGLGYGNLPFAPRVALEPVPILFAEFISWCPEAKIEGGENKLEVGDTRHFLGLALMTLGLIETVKLLPPQQWVAALNEIEQNELNDEANKAKWWQIVKEAATLLREKHGAKRLAVTGDLVRPQPLNYWSEITLVAYDLERNTYHEGSWALYQRFQENPCVHLADFNEIRIEDRNQLVEI